MRRLGHSEWLASALAVGLLGGGCSSDSFAPGAGLASGGAAETLGPSTTGGRESTGGASGSPASPDGSRGGAVWHSPSGGGDASSHSATGGRSTPSPCPASMPVNGDACRVDVHDGVCYYANGSVRCTCTGDWVCEDLSLPSTDGPSGGEASVGGARNEEPAGGASYGGTPGLAGQGGYPELGGADAQAANAGISGVESAGCPATAPEERIACSELGSVCPYADVECVCTMNGWRCLRIEGTGGSNAIAGAGFAGTPEPPGGNAGSTASAGRAGG